MVLIGARCRHCWLGEFSASRRAWPAGAASCSGRRGAPTALRCSPGGRASQLPPFAALTVVGQATRVRCGWRAAHAARQAALLGAADGRPGRPCPPLKHHRSTSTALKTCGSAGWLGQGVAGQKQVRTADTEHRSPTTVPPGTALKTCGSARWFGQGEGGPQWARLCAAEKRKGLGPCAQRTSTTDSPRLSERSARRARSELRGGAQPLSIAGHPRAAGASSEAPAAAHPRLGPRQSPCACARATPQAAASTHRTHQPDTHR